MMPSTSSASALLVLLFVSFICSIQSDVRAAHMLRAKTKHRKLTGHSPFQLNDDDNGSVASNTELATASASIADDEYEGDTVDIMARELTVSDTSIALKLTLVNSASEQDIIVVDEGFIMDITQVGRFINIRADSDDNVTSMDFSFDGDFVRTDSVPPFVLGGDFYGDYRSFVPLTVPGHHKVHVRAKIGTETVAELAVRFQVVFQTYAPTNPRTYFPTPSPSAYPSDAPSFLPSDVPSMMPSDQPSTMPSDLPSSMPSDLPSLMPSDQPSSMPSDYPSSMPSDQPSFMPSDQPSDYPSFMPSDQPSYMPSDQPSYLPSDQPSRMPSDQPSSMPSDKPSRMPSDKPSHMPSDQPSRMPSDQPSALPSDLPSSMPSDSPSLTPSDQPSYLPSDRPSVVLSDLPSMSTVVASPTNRPATGYVSEYFVNAGSDPKRPRYFQANETLVYRNRKFRIANADPYSQKVFQSYRSGFLVNYTFPGLEPSAMKNVTLGFAEIYKPNCIKGVGARVMNVTVNDVPFLTNMDVMATVPCYTAYYVQGVFAADASGHISVVFSAKEGYAFVSMLEIKPVGAV
jgi:Malectin domain